MRRSQLVLGAVIVAGVGCRKDPEVVQARSEAPPAPVAAAPEAAAPSESETLTLGDLPADGRATTLLTYDATALANTNLGSLRPQSAAFWGLSNKTAVTWLNTDGQIQSARQFTNFQEAIPKSDAILIVKRLCEDNYANQTLKYCLEAVAAQGGLFFEPKKPLAGTDPNDQNLILDYLDNAWGLVSLKDGTTPMYGATCAGCHFAASVLPTTGAEGVRLAIDVRGNNSAPDPIGSYKAQSLYDLWSGNLDDPNDKLFLASPRLKAAGLLAAQAKKWQGAYGANYHASSADVSNVLANASVSDAVDTMWLYAYLTTITSAKAYVASTTAIDDGTMIARNDRANAEAFLPSGARYAQMSTLFSTAPLAAPHRPQRATLPPTSGDMGPVNSFAFRYLSWGGMAVPDPVLNAQHYLSGATSAAVPFPSAFDATLAAAWYPGKTAAAAKAAVYAALPRRFVADYDLNSRQYHLLRTSYPAPVPAAMAPKIRASKAEAASAYVASSCTTCHTGGAVQTTPSTTGYGDCAYRTEASWATTAPCVVKATAPTASSWNNFTSAATSFANTIATSISSPSAAYDGLGITGLGMNRGVVHDPARATLLRWQGLAPSGYESFNEFLKKSRHGAKWAVLTANVSPSGTKIRTATNTYHVDVNGDGAVGATEPLTCNQTATFFIGGASVACHDLLVAMGFRPRLIGNANIYADLHASIKRPADYLGAGATQAQVDDLIDSVSTFLYGMRVGALMVQSDAAPTTYRYVTFQAQTPVVPTFSLPGGAYAAGQTISISLPNMPAGVSIYYTTDGSLPTSASTRYTGPITLTKTTVLSAIGNMMMVSTPPAQAVYTIK
jgi:hypothetical protein